MHTKSKQNDVLVIGLVNSLACYTTEPAQDDCILVVCKAQKSGPQQISKSMKFRWVFSRPRLLKIKGFGRVITSGEGLLSFSLVVWPFLRMLFASF